MLVLRRNEGQSVVITVGDVRIVVEVVRQGPGWAKLGVSAPHGVTIHRSEIQAKVDRENEHEG